MVGHYAGNKSIEFHIHHMTEVTHPPPTTTKPRRGPLIRGRDAAKTIPTKSFCASCIERCVRVLQDRRQLHPRVSLSVTNCLASVRSPLYPLPSFYLPPVYAWGGGVSVVGWLCRCKSLCGSGGRISTRARRYSTRATACDTPSSPPPASWPLAATPTGAARAGCAGRAGCLCRRAFLLLAPQPEPGKFSAPSSWIDLD